MTVGFFNSAGTHFSLVCGMYRCYKLMKIIITSNNICG